MFPTSTQRKHWMFPNEDNILEIKKSTHSTYLKSQFQKKKSLQNNKEDDNFPPSNSLEDCLDFFLSLQECERLLSFFEHKLMEFCSNFQPPMPKVVQGTAFHFFKRFYLYNSVMDSHPKEILVTAAYLACKVEEFNVSIGQFIANINGNKDRATDIILNNELLLMNEIDFDLTIHNPYRPVEGFMVDIKTRCKGAVNPESLRKDIDKFLNDVYFTPVCMIYSPSQIALASIIHAASKNGQNMDSYVLDVLFNKNDEKLLTLVESVKNIRLMVKNIESCPSLAEVKTIAAKLEKCRNQENNPDSQAYKRKMKEMVDEDDRPNSKHRRINDEVMEGIAPNT